MKTPRSRVDRLRLQVQRHNLHVVVIVLLNLALALALWAGAYFVAHWLALFFLTALFGAEAQLPAHFNLALGVIALALLAWVGVERWLRPFPKVADKKSRGAIASDFILALPRLTLALRDHGAAWLSLTRLELELAIDLLDRVRAARKFPLQHAPVEIPDDRMRENVIFALLHLRLVEMRDENGNPYLRLPELPPPPLAPGLGF